jgi:hypothetical protein
MRHADLARLGTARSPADQPGTRHAVMRRPKRRPQARWRSFPQRAAQRVDGRHLERLLDRQIRQQRGECTSEHGLADAWWPRHQHVEPARGRDFDGGLRPRLATDGGEIDTFGRVGGATRREAEKSCASPRTCWMQRCRLGVGRTQRPSTRLLGVLCGRDQRSHAGGEEEPRHREHAGHRPDFCTEPAPRETRCRRAGSPDCRRAARRSRSPGRRVRPLRPADSRRPALRGGLHSSADSAASGG